MKWGRAFILIVLFILLGNSFYPPLSPPYIIFILITSNHFYLFYSRLPSWVRKLFPFIGNVLQIDEKSWNMYPYSKTGIYPSPFLSLSTLFTLVLHLLKNIDAIYLVIVVKYWLNPFMLMTMDPLLMYSIHLFIIFKMKLLFPFFKIHNLSDDILNQREVKILDITEDPDDSSTIDLESASTFVSKKVKRGPLKEGWMNGEPVICAYKIVYAEFNVKGLRKRIEHFIVDVFIYIFIYF